MEETKREDNVAPEPITRRAKDQIISAVIATAVFAYASPAAVPYVLLEDYKIWVNRKGDIIKITNRAGAALNNAAQAIAARIEHAWRIFRIDKPDDVAKIIKEHEVAPDNTANYEVKGGADAPTFGLLIVCVLIVIAAALMAAPIAVRVAVGVAMSVLGVCMMAVGIHEICKK